MALGYRDRGIVVGRTDREILTRAIRLEDGAKALLKALAPEVARETEHREAFRREFELAGALTVEGLARPVELIDTGQETALVLEDHGDVPLTALLRSGGLELTAALRIARNLAATLAGLHQAGVVHRNIQPAAILVDPSTLATRLSGLGWGSRLPREQADGGRVSRLTNPAYMSPEQSGRLNRSVDSRADLYSLGVVLYELLTGRPPFDASSSEELAYAHVAREPVPPGDLVAGLPAAVSRLVLKLLAKSAEDRYQTGGAVRRDLERCLEAFERVGDVPLFPLGEHDAPTSLELSAEVFGRSEERGRLVAAVEAARGGATRVVLVSGQSGVGKTCLVEELRKDVLVGGGLFVAGRYHESSASPPHEGLAVALRSLVHCLLADTREPLASRATALRDALGPDLAALATLVPDLRLVTGPVPSGEELRPSLVLTRLKRAIPALLGLVARPDRLLVLFLDDLHWIDPPSAALVEAMLTGLPHNLLLVGALRSPEDASPMTPLLEAIGRCERQGLVVERIALGGLSVDATEQLIVRSLRMDVADAAPIARLVFDRTAGNPLLVKACLQVLRDEGALRFDVSSGWVWGPDRAVRPSAAGSEDPIDQILASLGAEERHVIAAVAAAGDGSELAIVAAACDRPVPLVEEALVALAYRDLVAVRDGQYRCVHERVRERALREMDADGRARVHLRVGEALADRLGGEPLRLYEVVGHFAAALPLLRDTDSCRRVARLNLDAARRARDAGAFSAAHRYCTHGLSLLPAEPWHSEYPITLALHCAAADAAYLTARMDEAERFVDEVVAHARTPVDAAPVYETRLAIAVALGRPEDAVRSAFGALEALGVDVPAEEDEPSLIARLERVCRVLDANISADPGTVAIMTDTTDIAAVRVLARALAPAAWTGHVVILRIVVAMAELVARCGHAREAGLAYGLVGMMRSRWLEDYEGGRRCALVGLQLLERAGAREWFPSAQCWRSLAIDNWLEPHRRLVDAMTEVYGRAMREGDPTAFVAAAVRCDAGLYGGVNLARLRAWVQQHEAEVRQTGHLPATMWLQHAEAVLDALQDGSRRVTAPSARPDSTRDQLTLCHRLLVSIVWRRTDEIRAITDEAVALKHQIAPGFMPSDFLLCLGLLTAPAGELPADRLAALDFVLARLRRRARACPAANQHKVDLVEAERLRVLGQPLAAIPVYDRAIAGADREAYVHEAALACELAGDMHRVLGHERIAAAYFTAAGERYARWHAAAKATDLAEVAAQLAGVGLAESDASALRPRADRRRRTAVSGTDLDLRSLEHAVVALSQEIALEPLLERLMTIVLQYSGATYGCLFRQQDDRLLLEASAASGGPVHVGSRAPVDDATVAAPTVVRYVARTREPLALSAAADDERFAGDPYIQRTTPRSILCTPVLNRGVLEAVLYLEHREVADAFVPERLAAVRLISSGATSALQNAYLLDDLTREVEARRVAERDLRHALDQVEALKNQLEAENVYLREEVGSTDRFEELIGRTEPLRAVFRRIRQVAGTEATVLIEGETGTGKELVARALHRLSARKDRPFVKVNCAALPSTLIESELFGHERGAFTGAITKKLGRFELADRGTLFLDEIGDMPLDLQTKLLRVLQDGEFERLGSGRAIKVDVRVIAATNRNLEKAVSAGLFRDDLYYRLKVFPILVPPLRSRPEDIPLLVWYFITKHQARFGKHVEKVPRAVIDTLTSYAWPGNVRELEHVIERALIVAEGPSLTLEDIAEVPVPGASPAAVQSSGDLRGIERSHILKVLEACGWRVKGPGNAADRLGLKPSTLRSRMKKLGLARSALPSVAADDRRA